MAHDVLTVLDRLELPDVLVVGHSLGGSVAMILDELRGVSWNERCCARRWPWTEAPERNRPGRPAPS